MQSGKSSGAGAASGGRPARHGAHHLCRSCGDSFAPSHVLPANLVRDNVAALIATHVPGWDGSGFICRSCLNRFRGEFVRSEMAKDRGELTSLEE